MHLNITHAREKWKGTMTDRQRFVNQMHFKSFDRCFNMEFGYWDEVFDQWDIFTRHNIKNREDAFILLGFDRIENLFGETFMLPVFEEKVVQERENTLIIQNIDGLLAEVPKDSHSTIPHFLHSSIITPDDWKIIKEERFVIKHPGRIPNIDEIKNKFPDDRDFPVGIDCGSMIGRIRDVLTFEGLCYAINDYPDMVEDMIETCCLLVEDFLDAILPHVRFDYARGWEDICYKNGPIVSPSFFKNIIAPRYKRINKKLKQFGIDIWYTDCDGDVRPILPILLDCGINCLFPFEVQSSKDPRELLTQYEGELRIMGGIDKTKLISGKEEIKEYLESIEAYVAKGGFIPFCDHYCPPDVNQDNYLFYLDLKEKMFGIK